MKILCPEMARTGLSFGTRFHVYKLPVRVSMAAVPDAGVKAMPRYLSSLGVATI